MNVGITGPGCSSVGIGAMVEIGPFGVKPDGKTLYTRKHAWNKGGLSVKLLSFMPIIFLSLSVPMYSSSYESIGK